MTDQAYNRTVLYPLEKPLADDLNQQFSQGDRSIRDTMYQLLRGAEGFLWNSFLVSQNSPPDLSVVLKAGVGFQDAPTDCPSGISSVLGLDDLSRYKPIVLTTDITVAVPAPPGADSRIDLIEVRYDRKTDNNQSRNFLDPLTSTFGPANVDKTLDFNVDGTLAYYAATDVPTTALAYKSGTAAASPTAPAVDTGYMAVAYITVASGVTTIVTSNIEDGRPAIATMRVGSQYLGRQTFTANGTYTPTPGTRRVRVTVVGGGGGSGGVANGGASSVGAVAAGASGVTVTKDFTGNPVLGGAVTIGAAGAGGAAGNNAGTDGGSSSIVVNGTTVTGSGGKGSAGAAASANSSNAEATGHNAGSANYDTLTAQHGGASFGAEPAGTPPPSTLFVAGNGGSSPFGIGGRGDTGGPAVAEAADGYGSGGGGIVSYGATDAAGASGTAGLVIVDEWG